MRDGIHFARQGIASVALVTEKFADEAAFVATAAGMSTVPVLTLPHPVAGSTDQRMTDLATRLTPAILAALTGQP